MQTIFLTKSIVLSAGFYHKVYWMLEDMKSAFSF